MIKVLAVDDEIEFIEKLKQYFYNTNINIVDNAFDGMDAIRILKENTYDVILLDLIMPNKDGFYVLEYLKDQSRNESVIIVTGNRSSLTINEVTGYNVDYYVLKPFDYSDLEEKINNVFKRKDNKRIINVKYNKVSNIVIDILHELGLPSSLNGYHYIKDSILYLYFDDSLTGFTTNLYQKLSLKYKVSTKSIDRSIKHAIETSYHRGNNDLTNDIFSYSVDDLPTNKEYILGILEKIKSLQL